MRLIIVSSNDGKHEKVLFTEQYDESVDELIFMNDMEVRFDGIIDDNILPPRFPYEYVLER